MKTFICYHKCTTCKKAEKWLDAQGIAYVLRAIREQNPSAGELRQWHEKSGLPLKRFFNTSGKRYRELGLSAKLAEMSIDEQLALLASDGMLVKRPLLVAEDMVLVGFHEAQWTEKLMDKTEERP